MALGSSGSECRGEAKKKKKKAKVVYRCLKISQNSCLGEN